MATAVMRAGEPLVISCGDCVMRMTSHCQDCLVSYLCETSHDAALLAGAGPSHEARQVHLNGEEVVALDRLARAGLVPELRFSLVS